MAGAGGGAGGVGWARTGRVSRAKHANNSERVVGMWCFMGVGVFRRYDGFTRGGLSAVMKPPLCKAPMKLCGRIVKPE